MEEVRVAMDSLRDAGVQLGTALTGFSDHFIGLSAALAGVGILSMALLQLIKDLFPVRMWFQCMMLRRWLRGRVSKAVRHELKLEPSEEPLAEMAEQMLIGLAMDGDRTALLSLPIEKLAGQINVGSQAVIEYPDRYRACLIVLAGGADTNDLLTLLGLSGSEDASRRDDGVEEKAIRPSEVDQAYIDAKRRVAAHIQRSLDVFQIRVTLRWEWLMKSLSIAFSILVIFLLVATFLPTAIDNTSEKITWILIATIGGFVAPVARDLVASLQKIRGRGT